jgi:pilus assembly protein CpaB
VLLLGLALALGGVAASDVAGREARLRRQLGPLVDVVVARRDLPAGARLRASDLAVRRVPARFVPARTVPEPAALLGQRTAVAVPKGADLGEGMLGSPASEPAGAALRRGERVVDVVAAARPDLITPGGRVDVLVTTEARPTRPGRTYVALEDVDVLAAAPTGDGGGDAAAGPRVSASLRVTLRQAVFLAAAQSFAHELRLLPRAPGDRRRGAAGLSATELG